MFLVLTFPLGAPTPALRHEKLTPWRQNDAVIVLTMTTQMRR